MTTSKIVPIKKAQADTDESIVVCETLHSIRRARDLIVDADDKVLELLGLKSAELFRVHDALRDSVASLNAAADLLGTKK